MIYRLYEGRQFFLVVVDEGGTGEVLEERSTCREV